MNDEARISDAGLRLLTRVEGFRTDLYDDAAGFCTIGYGHLVHRGRTGTNADAEAPFAQGVSENEGLALLRTDVEIAESAIKRCVRVPLRQNQFDALVCFIFNVGEGAFTGSTLLRCINRGELARAQEEFHRWTYAGGKVLTGLVRRRRLESELFGG